MLPSVVSSVMQWGYGLGRVFFSQWGRYGKGLCPSQDNLWSTTTGNAAGLKLRWGLHGPPPHALFILTTAVKSSVLMPSVLWRCWLCGRKGIRPVKNWVVGCCRGYLGWDADLHMALQMPLPHTISCSSKSRLVLPSWFLPFWYLLTRVVPDIFQKSSKMIVC